MREWRRLLLAFPARGVASRASSDTSRQVCDGAVAAAVSLRSLEVPGAVVYLYRPMSH